MYNLIKEVIADTEKSREVILKHIYDKFQRLNEFEKKRLPPKSAHFVKQQNFVGVNVIRANTIS